MSDPMTNTEVEDVLASIRRLVSDDKRPETASEQKPATDRLVLTPSLRVTEEDGPDDGTIEDVGDTVQEAEVAAEDVVEASDDGAKPWMFAETEYGVDADEGEGAADVAEHQPVEEGVADDGMAQQDDVPETGEQSETVSEALIAAELEREEAEFVWPEMPRDRADTDSAPTEATDTSELSDIASDDATDEDGSSDPDLEEFALPEYDAAVPKNDGADKSLGEKIAALETLVGRRDEEFEPDDPGADDYAGTEPPPMEWEDSAEASEPTPAAFVDTQSQKAPEAEPAQVFSADEDVLDEDALRELVSDIVREELQGALGERITRNVRKLVRREIHRALAAQELE